MDSVFFDMPSSYCTIPCEDN
ncbi:hypothetical protein CP09DC77_0717A, partial [Chlamydia psittaci 09DC77]